MITIGIDPGVSGAVAFIDELGRVAIEDIPTVKLPGRGMITRRIDGRSLMNIILANTTPGEPVSAFLEQVGTMGGEGTGKSAQGSLMRSLGCIEAVLEILRMPPTMVVPQTWKRLYGLKSNKAEALAIARKLYPLTAGTRLTLAKHDNRAEALLLAHYGRIKKELIG